MSKYTTKLQNIMEANIRLEKRLLNEQQQSTYPECVSKMGKETTSDGLKFIRGTGKWAGSSFFSNGRVALQGHENVYDYECDGDEILIGNMKMIDDHSGWGDILEYYKNNSDSNWKFQSVDIHYIENDKYIYKSIASKSTDGSDKTLRVYSDGDVYIFNSDSDDVLDKGTWSMSGDKPIFKLESDKSSSETTTDTETPGEITTRASGYVNDSDTDMKEAIVDKNKIMTRGSKGMLVQEVQHKLLKSGGYDQFKLTKDMEGCKLEVSRCDGIYGKYTKAAVYQYQKDKGLSKDGVVGKQTAKSMGLI